MILILDFGSQYTQLIARRVREARVYCEIHPCNLALDKIRALNPKGIILSGGPASLYEHNAPDIERAVLDVGCPVLGICYGMYVIAQHLGARSAGAARREYGPAMLSMDKSKSWKLSALGFDGGYHEDGLYTRNLLQAISDLDTCLVVGCHTFRQKQIYSRPSTGFIGKEIDSIDTNAIRCTHFFNFPPYAREFSC